MTHTLPRRARPISRYEAIYFVLGGIFVTVLLLTNIIGTKLILAFPNWLPNGFFGDGPITLTAGILTYPITFLVTDLVSEIYGKRRADLMVYTGFAMSLLMLPILWLSVVTIPSPIWVNPLSASYGLDTAAEMQHAFESVFYFPGILLFSSMLAYMVAQLLDNYLFHFWKRLTDGKHLWLRNNGSTFISQLVDTIVVNSIFLSVAFKLPWQVIAQIILANYVFKLVFAVCDTPFIYLGVYWVKRMLGLRFHQEVPEEGHGLSPSAEAA